MIAIVCKMGDNSLYPSDVTYADAIGSYTVKSVKPSDLSRSLTELMLCGLPATQASVQYGPFRWTIGIDK